MRNGFLTLISGGALIASLACQSSEPNVPIVYAQAGQTVKEAVESLPSSGGVVSLGIGTWSSGYGPTELITRPHITIQGSGIPAFNSSFTAMSGGTIVQGHLSASTGADYFTVKDLGVDTGRAYINANNGGMATDALTISNNGQVLGAAQVQAPRIENVACLGYSPTAAFHCMLVENVNHASIHNVVTVMNCHGLVLKGTNSTVDGVYARGHGIDAVIVKSDNYAPASHDKLFNILIEPLVAAGDTKGIIIIGLDAPVSDISISHATIHSPFAWGVFVKGATSTATATTLNLSDITVDYQGGSPIYEYCMQFVQYVSAVSISNLNCSNMWAGIAPSAPVPGSSGNFRLMNSQFTNIGTNGVETYGQWSIRNTSFGSIIDSAIVADPGVVTVFGNTFTGIGVTDMYSAGGSFVELTP